MAEKTSTKGKVITASNSSNQGLAGDNFPPRRQYSIAKTLQALKAITIQ